MADTIRLSLEEAFELARGACAAAGASAGMARCLAESSVSAEARGQGLVGLAHLPDYIAALEAGRIDGAAEPVLTSPAPAMIRCDVRGGVAQYGFDLACEDLARRAHSHGIALFALRGSYTTGELGWYVRRLVDQGLVALAATNGTALMKPSGADAPVYCTNPIAFGAPGDDGPALLVDQASSATAFVNLRRAAEAGEPIPAGWAVDAQGRATTEARAALGGALLTFGGTRGANIALMVEVLAAGLTGANWSLDAPSFASGAASPGAGLLVVAIAPAMLDPDFVRRTGEQMARLARHGVYVPGRGQSQKQRDASRNGLDLPASLVETLRRRARASRLG